MQFRVLGNTDLRCSILGLGTWGFGGSNDIAGTAIGWREIPESLICNTIRAAVDSGITFFDSSDFYGRGRSERLLAKALGSDRNRVVLATKGGCYLVFAPGQPTLHAIFRPPILEGLCMRAY
jgi:aryl-alcohol dehydrogenase-like predicted oxidoreductase